MTRNNLNLLFCSAAVYNQILLHYFFWEIPAVYKTCYEQTLPASDITSELETVLGGNNTVESVRVSVSVWGRRESCMFLSPHYQYSCTENREETQVCVSLRAAKGAAHEDKQPCPYIAYYEESQDQAPRCRAALLFGWKSLRQQRIYY